MATYLRDHLTATKDSVGCAGTPTPVYSCRDAHAVGLFLCNLRYFIPVRAYNKSWYLVVHFGSALDIPGPLSRVCTGPILNMVHRTSSVFKQLAL